MRIALVTLMSTTLAAAALGETKKPLAPELSAFAPFVGKTYRGEFANSTAEKPVVDVQQWERALNGMAIRIRHSINDGEYGGETFLFWDRSQAALVYYYFTTAGFFTHGTMEARDGGFVAHEFVEGGSDGTTEVRSTATLLDDGRVHQKAAYLRHGEWVDGHEVTYAEAPDAEVNFR